MCSGFSLLAAAGPFSTSDSLEMTPLDDVITRVKEEQPSILLLVSGSLCLSLCLPVTSGFVPPLTRWGPS